MCFQRIDAVFASRTSPFAAYTGSACNPGATGGIETDTEGHAANREADKQEVRCEELLLAEHALEMGGRGRSTLADERVYSVDALAVVLAGQLGAVVDVDFTVVSREPNDARTRVIVDQIGAAPAVRAWYRSALVGLELAVRSPFVVYTRPSATFAKA